MFLPIGKNRCYQLFLPTTNAYVIRVGTSINNDPPKIRSGQLDKLGGG